MTRNTEIEQAANIILNMKQHNLIQYKKKLKQKIYNIEIANILIVSGVKINVPVAWWPGDQRKFTMIVKKQNYSKHKKKHSLRVEYIEEISKKNLEFGYLPLELVLSAISIQEKK